MLAYLLGASDSHSVGLYQVSLRTIARHNDLTDEWAKVAVDALRGVSLAYYDEDREVVFVPVMAEVEHPDGVKPPDNNHKHIVKYLQTPTLRRSRYFGAFMKAHRARFNLPRPAGDHDGGDAGGGSGPQRHRIPGLCPSLS